MLFRGQYPAEFAATAVGGECQSALPPQFQLITRPSQALGASSQRELTQFLWQRCLLAHSESYAPFVTHKIISLAVRAACLDWNALGSELLQTTQQLLGASGNPTAVGVGLATFATLVDESTGSPVRLVASGLLTGAQAKAVHTSITASLPALTAAVCSTMQAAADGRFSGASSASQQVAASSPGASPRQKHAAGFFSGTTDATSVNYKLASRAVSVLSIILSEWGLGHHVTVSGLNTVLALVTAGLRASHSSKLQTDATLSAVNCVIDMVRTPRVPDEFGALFGEIATHMLRGVEHMLLPSPSSAHQTIMQTLPEEVSSKFAEFVGIFVQYHAGRFESMQSFNMTEFVSAFFGMTVALADTTSFSQEGYLSCVSGWNTLIERLLVELSSDQGVSQSSLLYLKAVEALATKLFDSVQFSTNGDMLSMLEDGDGADSPDDAASLAGSVSTVATSGSVRLGLRGGGSGFNTPTKRPPTMSGYTQDLKSMGGAQSGPASIFGHLLEEDDDLEEGGVQGGSGPGAGGERQDSSYIDVAGAQGEVQSILQQVFGASSLQTGTAGAGGGTELDGYLTQCLALLGRIGRLPTATTSLVQSVLQQLREVVPVAKAAVDGSSPGSDEAAQWAVYDTSTLCALMAALAHVWTNAQMQSSAAVQQSAGEVLMLTASLGAAVGAALRSRAAHSSHAHGAAVSTLPVHLLHRLQRACFTCLLGMLPWLDAHLPGQTTQTETLSMDTAQAVLTDIVTLVFSAVDTRGAVSPPADSTIASAVSLFSALGQRSHTFVTLCSQLPLMCTFVTGLADITAALPTEAQAHLLAAVCKLLFNTSISSSEMGDSQSSALQGVLSAYTSPLSKLAGSHGTADSAAIQAAVAADRSLPVQLKRTCIILSAVVRALGGAQGSGDARAALRQLFMPVVDILLRAVPVFLSPSTSAALMARRQAHARSTAPQAPSSIAVTCLNTASSAMRFIKAVVKYLGCANSDMPSTVVRTVATPIVQAVRLGLLVPSRQVHRGRSMSAPGSGAGSHSATKVLLYFLRLFGECAAVVPGKDSHSQAMISLVDDAVLQSGLLTLIEGQQPQSGASAEAAGEVHMDLSPALHFMLRRHLVTHWRGFAQSIVKGGQFRSTHAAHQAQLILGALQASMARTDTPPALMRLHLVSLHSLQAQHRAFSLPAMRTQVLPSLLQLIMKLQLQRQAALLSEELQACLWELLQAAAEPDEAALQCIQGVLSDMPWLQAAHMQQLNAAAESGITAVRRMDASGFASSVASICNDLRVWGASQVAH